MFLGELGQCFYVIVLRFVERNDFFKARNESKNNFRIKFKIEINDLICQFLNIFDKNTYIHTKIYHKVIFFFYLCKV